MRYFTLVIAIASLLYGTAVCAPNVVVVSGHIVDSASGLPLSNVAVRDVGSKASTESDVNGYFTMRVPNQQSMTLIATARGYVSTQVLVLASEKTDSLIISLQRSTNPTGSLTEIASVTAHASQTLQSASVISATLPSSALAAQGYSGLANALMTLPGVNYASASAGYYSPNPGKNVSLDIRGIGALETASLVDGHPLPQFSYGYDFENTPLFGLRQTQVVYGSGAGEFYSVDAIGGVVDMQTLQPTRESHMSLSQSVGSLVRSSTAFQATGPVPQGALNFPGQFSYAVAYGVVGESGPHHNERVFQPGFAVDQSAPPGSAAHDSGYTVIDSVYNDRSSLVKLSYAANANTTLTGDVLTNNEYAAQGGAVVPYSTPADALAHGNQLLAGKSPSDPCPAGTFTGTNSLGIPNGSDLQGNPTGGMRCQTPDQYAAFNAGYEFAFPGYNEIRDTDYNLQMDSNTNSRATRINVFTNTFSWDQYTYPSLPFGFLDLDALNTGAESGISASQRFIGTNGEIGLGYAYTNEAVRTIYSGLIASNSGSAYHDFAYFARAIYQRPGSPLRFYLYDWWKHNSGTRSSYSDPRIAVAYQQRNNVLRVAFGATSTQPGLDQLGQPYVPQSIGAFRTGLSCSAPNYIGNAPSSVLTPERGIDEELSVGHRFGGDSIVQLSLYNEAVYQKIYNAFLPLNVIGTAFIPPDLLSQYLAIYTNTCGGSSSTALSNLAAFGNFNIGEIRAAGVELTGRARLSRTLAFDYSYDVQSSKLFNLNAGVLRGNPTLIIGSQLPQIPLHKASLDALLQFPRSITARIGAVYFDGHNALAAPAYVLLNGNVAFTKGNVTLNFAAQNLLNKYPDDRLLFCSGLPLAVNQYVTANPACLGPSYVPLGGLGGRRLLFTVQVFK